MAGENPMKYDICNGYFDFSAPHGWIYCSSHQMISRVMVASAVSYAISILFVVSAISLKQCLSRNSHCRRGVCSGAGSVLLSGLAELFGHGILRLCVSLLSLITITIWVNCVYFSVPFYIYPQPNAAESEFSWNYERIEGETLAYYEGMIRSASNKPADSVSARGETGTMSSPGRPAPKTSSSQESAPLESGSYNSSDAAKDLVSKRLDLSAQRYGVISSLMSAPVSAYVLIMAFMSYLLVKGIDVNGRIDAILASQSNGNYSSKRLALFCFMTATESVIIGCGVCTVIMFMIGFLFMVNMADLLDRNLHVSSQITEIFVSQQFYIPIYVTIMLVVVFYIMLFFDRSHFQNEVAPVESNSMLRDE